MAKHTQPIFTVSNAQTITNKTIDVPPGFTDLGSAKLLTDAKPVLLTTSGTVSNEPTFWGRTLFEERERIESGVTMGQLVPIWIIIPIVMWLVVFGRKS